MLLGQCSLDDRVRKAMDLFWPGDGAVSYKVSEIARSVGISPSQLTRLFQQEVGAPPCRVRKTLRLEEAERLLVSTRMSVKEIAHKVLYNDVRNFVRDFEATYGMSPARYRRAIGSVCSCENLAKERLKLPPMTD